MIWRHSSPVLLVSQRLPPQFTSRLPLPVNPHTSLKYLRCLHHQPHPLARSVPSASRADGSPNKHNLSMLRTAQTAVWCHPVRIVSVWTYSSSLRSTTILQLHCSPSDKWKGNSVHRMGKWRALHSYFSTLHQNLIRTIEIHKISQTLAPGRHTNPEPAEHTTRWLTLYQEIRWRYCSEQGHKLQRAHYCTFVVPRSRNGGAIAQAVSRRLPTSAARFRSQVKSCGICGGQIGVGTGFPRVLRFPLTIPPTAPQSSSISSRAGTIRQLVADVPSGLSLTPPQETNPPLIKMKFETVALCIIRMTFNPWNANGYRMWDLM
jgi:hypothetical protein